MCRRTSSSPLIASQGDSTALKMFAAESFILPVWIIVTVFSMILAAFIPRHQSKAGQETFLHAGFDYDETNTYFDNTFLTYGTDYMISIIMLYAVHKCLNATSPINIHNNDLKFDVSLSKDLRIGSSLLFLLYGVSVLSGGIAHQFYTNLEDLNSLSFRILWTLCVGCVTAAGGLIGACGSAIYIRLNETMPNDMVRFRMIYLPYKLWIIYGVCMTFWCILGGISYKRPACDIFAAGTTQFVPSVYIVLAVLSVKWPIKKERIPSSSVVRQIGPFFRLCIVVGFFLNAPLLPMYPLMVQYTSLSLGVVNALLHLNLTFAWGMQAMSLHHFCKGFNITDTEKSK